MKYSRVPVEGQVPGENAALAGLDGARILKGVGIDDVNLGGGDDGAVGSYALQ